MEHSLSCVSRRDPGGSKNTVKKINKDKYMGQRWDHFLTAPKVSTHSEQDPLGFRTHAHERVCGGVLGCGVLSPVLPLMRILFFQLVLSVKASQTASCWMVCVDFN